MQPSFILWKILQLFGVRNNVRIRVIHSTFLRLLSVCSSLHLMLVTCERLIAIKFTMRHPYIVTSRNIKVAVIALWVFTFTCEVIRRSKAVITANILVGLGLNSCILFVVISYVILYRETVRQESKIKAQQLPQEEVERFAKESKVLKTTVFLVGAVVLCFLPLGFAFVAAVTKLNVYVHPEWIRTWAMLNSLLNPLIYCWRQKEMRQYVFKISSPSVAAVN